ncbi:phosphomannomutase/phosphoglucomutase [candidate division WS5 bacterium]|uniref:Phosphomannomutase/phosphoglucomutase n=1 Tax=candidate division WS5 bacterium TaxID=2093353 RepID=A0A419DGM9_9BACT|nr:MAG: phosphomannomutase/phosphoglucomutase [candidate division WS5 bacterium]
MKINPRMFRGYDLRGLVDKDLNPEIVEHIGRAHGTYMKRSGITRAVVGRDCRATSEEYSKALIRGYSWAGVDTVDIGMNLVGTFYWSQYHLNIKGGAFVTASHNPPEYNGFKFACDFSETLVSDGMNELRRMVEEEDYEEGEKPGKVEEQDIREAYFEDIIKRLPISKKFKVLVDPSFSTAGSIVPDLLRKADCEVIEKNCEINPAFPLGTPDPTESKVAERVKKEVLEEKADIGFTYDADGDRIGIIDEKGGIIWNDVLVAIFASDVLAGHPGAKIMYNTLCSKVVEDTIKEKGGEPFMWRTGHSFLKKKNQEIGAAFIGELSGHFFFSADFYNHDDGIYSTFRLLHYLSETNQSLSEAVDKLPKYISSPEIKIGCADDKKVALIGKISSVLEKDFPEAEVISDERAGDGVRLNMDDSMFVVRYSQNGPYLTVKFEARTQEKYDSLKDYLNKLLHGYEEIDWENDTVNAEALE